MSEDAPIAELFSEQGNVYAVRGTPLATDNYHDISNYEINSTQGFPNREFKIRFNGMYKYINNKEAAQEGIVKLRIDWGDGESESYIPSNWPFQASHRFGVEYVYDSGLGIGSYRINVTEETTYDIKIYFTTTSGTVFLSTVKYTIHMNRDGRGSPAGTSNKVNDYWHNPDCVMVNNLCYQQEISTKVMSKKDISVPLTSSDRWKDGEFTHYEGLSFVEKNNECKPPWEVVGNKCRLKTVIPGEEIISPAETYEWSAPNYPVGWFQWEIVYLKDGYNFSIMNIDWSDYFQPLILFGGESGGPEKCTAGKKRAVLTAAGLDPLPSGNEQYYFSGSCVRKVVFAGCPEGGNPPIFKNGIYSCSSGKFEDEVVYEFDEAWETCHNKPELTHVKDDGGNITVTGDFSCYSSIVVKSTCEAPYIHRNGRCEWDDVTNTPLQNQTSDEIPKDTYRRVQ